MNSLNLKKNFVLLFCIHFLHKVKVHSQGVLKEVYPNLPVINNDIVSGKYFYKINQLDFSDSIDFSKTIDVQIDLPDQFFLDQNYPNPFNSTTRIIFSFDEKSSVSFKFYDILDQEKNTILNKNLNAGYHFSDFNSSEYSSGVFFYLLVATNEHSQTYSSIKKMIILK